MEIKKFDPLVVGYVVMVGESYLRDRKDGKLGFMLYRNRGEAQRVAWRSMSKHYSNLASGRSSQAPGETPLPVKFDDHSRKFVVCTPEGKPTKQLIAQDAINLVADSGQAAFRVGTRVELTEVRAGEELAALYVVRDGELLVKAEGAEVGYKRTMLEEIASVIANTAGTRSVAVRLRVEPGANLEQMRASAEKGDIAIAPDLRAEPYLKLASADGAHKLELHESEVGWHLVDTAATPPWCGELWAEKSELTRAAAVQALEDVREYHASFTGVKFKDEAELTVAASQGMSGPGV